MSAMRKRLAMPAPQAMIIRHAFMAPASNGEIARTKGAADWEKVLRIHESEIKVKIG
jgi:hypothetical protein